MKWAVAIIIVLGSALALWFALKMSGARAEYVPVQPAMRPSQEAEADVAALATAHNAFGFALYEQLHKENEPNVFFSPSSIALTLSMAAAGAEGDTLSQMLDVLHWKQPEPRLHAASGAMLYKLFVWSHAGQHLRLANSLWLRQGEPVNPNFIKTLDDYYGSALHMANFAADPRGVERQINQWVAQHTNGRIDQLMKPGTIDPQMTALVLVNAMHFQGKWHEPFEPHDTKPEMFELSGGNRISVPMMQQTTWLSYHRDAKWHAVELEYHGGGMSMVIILPLVQHDLREIEPLLGDETTWAWLDKPEGREVELWLPKFTFRARMDLIEPLTAMGMTDAFDHRSDFSRMTTNDQLFINACAHEAWLRVDEEGTEAAAVTEMEMAAEAIDQEEEGLIKFHVDRPCVFAIRHNPTGRILFLGRLGDPTRP